MEELEDESIALTVTSPPYRNAIDYDSHTQDKEEWYRGAELWNSTKEYLEQMQEHFKEVFRVTKVGGYCCIVIGNEIDTSEKKLEPLPSLLIPYLLQVDWVLHEEIIWNKVTGGKKRFRVTVQHPYPTYYYSNIMHEHILVVRKGGRIKSRDEQSRFDLDDLWKKEIANSVWHVPPVPPNANIPHPCPFPDEIARRLILVYSNVGDQVLDPFSGSGTTIRVAKTLGRIGIGYDINQDYCAYAQEKEGAGIKTGDPIIPKWNKWKSEESIDTRETDLSDFLLYDPDGPR
jgi:site-specific DNA-methyltransferase (adenine-specific)